MPLIANSVPYLGQVAGQAFSPTTSGSSLQIMVRGRHISRDTITSLRIAYPNWCLTGTTEVGPGGIATITAAIEYPIGTTCTQVTWGGSASHTIANNAQGELSDEISVSIPIDTPFMIRTYYTNPAAVLWINKTGIVDNSQGLRFANSGLSDQTMAAAALSGGTSSNNFLYKPNLILGMTSRPSILIIGDSRQEGSAAGESYTGTSDDIGTIARSLGPYFAYSNLGKGGDNAYTFLVSNTKRLSLAPYFSHVVCGYGVNDIRAGHSAAVTFADLKSLRALFPDNIFYQCTITPEADTSSDFYTTVAGQNTGTAGIATLNDLIRGNTLGDGYFEVADILESSRNSKKWIVSPNGRVVTDLSTTTSSTIATSATANFTTDDTGNILVCTAAGYTSSLARTMTFSSSTTVIMSANATATLTGGTGSIQAMFYTRDGLHETTNANLLVATENAIDHNRIQIPGDEPPANFATNTGLVNSPVHSESIPDGLIKAIQKVWIDTYVFSSAIPTGTTVDIAVLPKNKKINSVVLTFPSLSTEAAGTGTTISIGVRNNTTATGSTFLLNAGEAASGTFQLEANTLDGLYSTLTGSTNRIYMQFDRLATATTAGTIFTVVKYT